MTDTVRGSLDDIEVEKICGVWYGWPRSGARYGIQKARTRRQVIEQVSRQLWRAWPGTTASQRALSETLARCDEFLEKWREET